MHHWSRAESATGHVFWVCRCGVEVDWTAVRDAWDAWHEEGAFADSWSA